MLVLTHRRGGFETQSVHNMISEIAFLAGAEKSSGIHRILGLSQLAVTEAFAWLEAQALLVPKPGSSGWSVLSRRVRRFETEEDFSQFDMARRLNRVLRRLRAPFSRRLCKLLMSGFSMSWWITLPATVVLR